MLKEWAAPGGDFKTEFDLNDYERSNFFGIGGGGFNPKSNDMLLFYLFYILKLLYCFI